MKTGDGVILGVLAAGAAAFYLFSIRSSVTTSQGPVSPLAGVGVAGLPLFGLPQPGGGVSDYCRRLLPNGTLAACTQPQGYKPLAGECTVYDDGFGGQKQVCYNP